MLFINEVYYLYILHYYIILAGIIILYIMKVFVYHVYIYIFIEIDISLAYSI